MTDIITRGIEQKTGAPPFETASPPPSHESDAPDIVTQHIPDAIDRGDDERNIRAAMEETRKQREQGGDEIDDIGKRQIDELRYDGREHGQKSLREATKDISDWRILKQPEAQWVMKNLGLSEADALATAKDTNYLLSLGYTQQEADAYGRRLETPATKVTPVRDDGRPVRPLRDDEPVGPEHAFHTRSELKRGVKNFRQAAADAQQRLISEMTAAAEQRQATAEQAAPPQQQQAPPEQPQPRPQESQPDERQQLQAQLAATQARLGASFEEERALAELNKWRAWSHQNFPELESEEAIKAATPARRAQLEQAARQVHQGIAGWMRHGAAATQARQQQEQQLAVHSEALLQHTYKQFADSQDALFARQAPEMKNPAQARQLRDATQAMLRGVGFTDAEVQGAWKGQTGIALRDARAQMILRKAALWDQAQARAKQVTKASVPPVQRPGTYRPRGAGDLETVQRLERELHGATGDRAVRLGTRLQQARRAAGV